MPDIFISHATKDKHLAENLVQLLKEGIGVPDKAIFCSSLDGHGIPFGEDFNAYMKDQNQEPKLVLLLMTPAYMESWFCLMEVGAAWSKSHRSLAIVVPPIEFDVVTSTLGLKQAWDITHHPGLIDLRNMVQECEITLETRSDHTWEKKRSAWKSALREALKKLNGPSTVAADTHLEALGRVKEQEDEIDTLQELLEEEKEKVAALVEAKGVLQMAEFFKASNGDKWEIYKDTKSEWRWRRTASNGNIVGAATEGYVNKSDCIANAERNGMTCTPL